MFTGVIIDTFGRKIPVIIGFIVSGLSIAAIPYFSSLYPSYLILRTLISGGTVIGLNIPLLPDYVSPESMGLANAYVEVAICSAFIFASSGLYKIA
jgi:MFS family permease